MIPLLCLLINYPNAHVSMESGDKVELRLIWMKSSKHSILSESSHLSSSYKKTIGIITIKRGVKPLSFDFRNSMTSCSRLLNQLFFGKLIASIAGKAFLVYDDEGEEEVMYL